MPETQRIVLLDLDGVLLQPGGYRKAVTDTIHYFTRQAGLPDLAPEEEVLAFFESKGITNEWDIVPICLAAILETLRGDHPDLDLPGDWSLASANITRLDIKKVPVNYKARIQEISRVLKVGLSPSSAIYLAGNENKNQPFPLLSRQPIFKILFQNNQDVLGSVTTRIFQNYVLGSDLFRETYGIAPAFVTPSYLALYDRPLLSKAAFTTLLDWIKEKRLSVVACTARPSLPPKGAETGLAGYSPEAELALGLAGLSEIPLIAYGRLKYAADLFKVSPDLLIKPSPFQALAAIAVASIKGKDEGEALTFAGEICKRAGLFSIGQPSVDLNGFLSGLRETNLVVHVVEDSPIGVQAAKQACQVLADLGIPIEFHGWGVALDGSKVNALRSVGARVFTSLEDIIMSGFLADLPPKTHIG